jgi:hypothetical protein
MVRFPGGVHKLNMPDPDVEWAVSKKSASVAVDHHGTLDM